MISGLIMPQAEMAAPAAAASLVAAAAMAMHNCCYSKLLIKKRLRISLVDMGSFFIGAPQAVAAVGTGDCGSFSYAGTFTMQW